MSNLAVNTTTNAKIDSETSYDSLSVTSDSSSVGFYSSSEAMVSTSAESEEYDSDQSFEREDADYAKLSKAIMNGNLEMVKKVILSGIDLNHIYDREQNYSFLHLACLMGHSEIIKVLLDNGAKTNLVTIDGQQAIDFIEPDDLNTISYMLKKMSTTTSPSSTTVTARQQ